MPISSRPIETATYRLKIVASAVEVAVGRELALLEGNALIGRADDCQFMVPDSAMSRHHARVEVAESGIKVVDNGSANGVFLDGQRVSEAVLAPGRRFVLGRTTFEVVLVQPEQPPAAPPGATNLLESTMAVVDVAEIVAKLQGDSSLEQIGEKVVALANRPFLLSDPDAVYIVASGKVEVFTVQVEAGQPVGARTHFVTVETGQALFGIDTDRYGMGSGFLAVGKAGSELRKFSAARLLRLASIQEYAGRIAKLLEIWLEALSRRLIKDLPDLPQPDISLEVPKEIEAKAGQKIGCGRGVAWVEMPAAQFLFDGMGSLSYEVEGVLFPFAPGTWVEQLASGDETWRVAPRATATVVGDPRLWAGLEVFHRILCECEFLNKRLATVDEYNRLQDKAVQIEAARDAGYAAIGSVLGGTTVFERPSAGMADLEPVYRACMLVGRAQGVEMRSHPESKQLRTFEESVLAVALASRLRARRVALVDDWWNHDQGPLLGQFEEAKTAVALLPVGTSKYVAIDPVTNTRTTVDARFAKTLSPFAFTFYRGFGDGPVTAKQFIKFAVTGLGPDFRSVAIMGIALGVMGTLAPTITGKVFDTAIPQAERGMLWQFSLGLFVSALAQAAFKITQNIAMLRVQGKMDYSAQSAVWDRLLDLPLTFFRKFSAGDLADRAEGVDQIRSIVAGAGIAAILGSFSSLFNVVQMVTYNITMALVAIGLTLVYVGSTTGANFIQLRYQREEQKRRGRITGLILQLINGVAKLRVCGAENHAFRVWATSFSEQRKLTFKTRQVQNVMSVFNASFPVLSSLIIFMTMVSLQESAAQGGTAFAMSTGDFLAFNAAFGMFIGAMQALGDASLSMLKIVPVWERLKPIVETTPEIDGTKAYPGKLAGGIEVSHVSFRYATESPWILKDISLKIKPGEFVALVGGSGSGKSTLMRLLLGFEKAEMGSIYYDGQDLATLDPRMVRSQMGVVLQESRLLPADIFRNIVGSSSRTLQDAWEAAEKAGLADDIKAMPMQMHTVISEGGGAFSGGQKQRLMIARAIVHKPKIIYLDEATSALDNRTQAIVTESMNKLAATRIVIAHRLSTIVDADRICFLEQGQLKEQGTYKELMALDGLFAQLAKRQLA